MGPKGSNKWNAPSLDASSGLVAADTSIPPDEFLSKGIFRTGNLEVGVFEGSVRKTKAELVSGLNVFLPVIQISHSLKVQVDEIETYGVKPAVINQEALGIGNLRLYALVVVHDLSRVILGLLGNSVRQLGRGVCITVENVDKRVAGLLARKTSPEDLRAHNQTKFSYSCGWDVYLQQ
jgi:hypothetical protein